MDPITHLRQQRELAARIIATEGSMAEDCVRLAELVQALDEWRKAGGFDPYARHE